MNRPVVLTFSGHDPVGGAGVQADIETLVSHQCHAASVITALTEQDTHNVKKLIPQRADDFIAQARTVLNDLDVKAFKIGLIGSYDIALAIDSVLSEHSAIPVILDPVLASGGGTNLSSQTLLQAIIDLLLPRTTVLTPNSTEARNLTGLNDLNACGLKLLALGCQSVLITGTHESTPSVSNQLFYEGCCFETYTWDRLPASYHGSGCTLAASIAALIAHGVSIEQAVLEAQHYTWQALQAAYQPSNGQYNPNRFFWMEQT